MTPQYYYFALIHSASHSLSLSLHYSRECRRLCDMRMHFQHLTIYPNQDAPVQVGVCVYECFLRIPTHQLEPQSHSLCLYSTTCTVQVAAAAPQSNHARTHATSTTTRRLQYKKHIQKKRSFPPSQFIVWHTTNSPSPPHSHYDDGPSPIESIHWSYCIQHGGRSIVFCAFISMDILCVFLASSSAETL